MKKILIFSLFIVALGLISCKKFLDTNPPKTELTGITVFSNDGTATGALTSIYSQMENEGFIYNLIRQTGLSSDEFVNYDNTTGGIDLAFNNLTPENGIILGTWSSCYKYIYQANAIIEGLEISTGVTQATKQRLTGEAKFIRAFCYFYLVNLFGDVPIIRSTDFRSNANKTRDPRNDVYNFLIEELKSAASLLSEDYVDGNNTLSSERVRPNKWTATALLARAYLYIGNWSEAELESSKIISANSVYTILPDLSMVFLKNSREAIWQIMATAPLRNSYPGSLLILTGTPSTVSLRPELVNSFQNSDNRKQTWINSIVVGSQTYFFPFKYKVGQNSSTITEYTMILRLSEQYLIRAEARARQNNFSEANSDLNTIRTRAGLTPLSISSLPELLDNINNERKLELFTELGDRWINLKRTNTADAILSIVKGNNWNPTDQLYPIPQTEILRNPNLTQNAGY
jgi:starch-binding outer membrane protein, SusD/RagB family